MDQSQVTTINGKTYRLAESCIPTDSRFDRVRVEFQKRGILDYVNARPPRSRKRFVQIFLMADGTAMLASSRTIHEVCIGAKTK